MFEDRELKQVSRATLPVGDYACELNPTFRIPVVFERKSLGDLFGTLTQGYERFKRELEKAKELNIKVIIIIEGTLTKVLKGYKHSQRPGISIIKQLFTLWIKYDVIPVFCKDREEMQKYIINFYSAISKKAVEDLKIKKGEE